MHTEKQSGKALKSFYLQAIIKDCQSIIILWLFFPDLLDNFMTTTLAEIILFHRFLSLVLSYAKFLLPALRCLSLPAPIWGRRQWHPTPVLLPGKSHGQEEPRRLQSMGSLPVGHDWATSLSPFTFLRWRRKWQPTPGFLPGESQGRRSLVGCRLWGHTESDTTEAT